MDPESFSNSSSATPKEDFFPRAPILAKNNLDYTSVLIHQELADVLMNTTSLNCSNLLENSTLSTTYSDRLINILCSQSASFDADRSSAPYLNEQAIFLLAIYSVILVLSVTGNLLVLVTLLQHRRMRTPTNILLLNLSASDLLLIVVCVPFTLTGSLLRDFIFGRLACHIIPYLQAVSVSVSAWTLVTISHERYSGICRPLKSRGWRTAGHARKKIAWVWVLSLTFMSPIAIISQLQPIGSTGRHKCREHWPSSFLEKLYSISLMIFLLLIPLLLMVLAYVAIRKVLNQSISNDRQNSVRFPRSSAIPSTLTRRNTCQMSKWSSSSFKSGRKSSGVEDSLQEDDEEPQVRAFKEHTSSIMNFLHGHKWTSSGDKKLRTLRTIQEVENHGQTKELLSETSFRKPARNISKDSNSVLFREPDAATLGACNLHDFHSCSQNSSENLVDYKEVCPDADPGVNAFHRESALSSSSAVSSTNFNRENVRASKISIPDKEKVKNKEEKLFTRREGKGQIEHHVDEDDLTTGNNYNYLMSSSEKNQWGDLCRQAFELKRNSVLTIDEQNQKRPSVNLHRGLVTYTETEIYESSKNWKLPLASSRKRRSQGFKNESNPLRSTSSLKALKEKQRMIRMIGVVVLEFFVCWTPLYVMNTVALYDLSLVYGLLGMKGVSAVQLLAYCSACCNPITYCFMSKSFRSAFLNVIRCRKSNLARC